MAYPVLKEKKPKSIDVSPDLGNPQPRDVSSSPFVPGGLNSRVSRCPAMMEKCGCGADPLALHKSTNSCGQDVLTWNSMPTSQAFPPGRAAVASGLSPHVVPLSQKAIGQIQRNAQSPLRSPQRLQAHESGARSSISPGRKEESQRLRGAQRDSGPVTPRSQLRSWLTQRIQAVQIEISQFQNTRLRRDTRDVRRDSKTSSQATITPRRHPASHAELRRETRSASPPATLVSRMKGTSASHRLSERSLRQVPVKRPQARPTSSSPPRAATASLQVRRSEISAKSPARVPFGDRAENVRQTKSESSVTSSAQEEAARRLQQFVRRWQKGHRSSIASRATAATASASPGQESEKICLSDSSLLEMSERVSQPTPPLSLEAEEGSQRMQNSDGRLRCVHHAASRIQRAWRISRWRRCFVDFSRHQVGWLGSLSWLRRHHCLYGNELADSEDVRWWLKQRQGAPLDHQVDPWGFHRLQEHLARTWQRSSKPSRSSSTAGPTISGPSRSLKTAKAPTMPVAGVEGRKHVSTIFPARPLQAHRASEGLPPRGKNLRLSSQCSFPGHQSSSNLRRCGSGTTVSKVPDRSAKLLNLRSECDFANASSVWLQTDNAQIGIQSSKIPQLISI
eukprot:s82_g13.t1